LGPFVSDEENKALWIRTQELCKDFCNRYITCLKGKMQSENLLRSDYGGYDSDDSGGGSSGGLGPTAAVAATASRMMAEARCQGYKTFTSVNY
jgi:hypothetical protein